jgi:hypothetical protein
MKSTLLILALSFGFMNLHCKQEQVNDVDCKNAIVGKWNWIKSCGGIAGRCNTPESTHSKIVIGFTKDSIFRKYENDKLLIETTFKITRGKSIFSQDSAQLIEKKDMLVESFSFATSDTLFLNEECFDCYKSKYVRIK